MTLFGWTVQVSKARLFRSTVLTLLFRKFQESEISYFTTYPRSCRCGAAPMCHKNCRGLEVWMSGSRNQPSFDAPFLLTSSKSLSAGVTVFGFTIMVCLRTLQGGTTCFSSGRRLISDILRTLRSSVRSFSTWLRAKLIIVVSVSFILSVAVLAILISVLLYLLTKLLRLKTSCLEFSRRLVKMLRRTSS